MTAGANTFDKKADTRKQLIALLFMTTQAVFVRVLEGVSKALSSWVRCRICQAAQVSTSTAIVAPRARGSQLEANRPDSTSLETLLVGDQPKATGNDVLCETS